MLRRMARRLGKWFNNECGICGMQRAPRFTPFCSEQCQAEHARREALFRPRVRGLNSGEVERMYQHHIYYGGDM